MGRSLKTCGDVWRIASLSKELLKVAGDEGGNSIAIKKVKALT